MTKHDRIIECPCYWVCAGLEVATGRWCRYRESAVPSPGMHRFDPKDEWCPTGVQANVLMLGYMLADGRGEPERLRPALDRVRGWAQELRRTSGAYDPAQPSERRTKGG